MRLIRFIVYFFLSQALFAGESDVLSREARLRAEKIAAFFNNLTETRRVGMKVREGNPLNWTETENSFPKYSEEDWKRGLDLWRTQSKRNQGVLYHGLAHYDIHVGKISAASESSYRALPLNHSLPDQIFKSFAELIKQMQRWHTVKPTQAETLLYAKNRARAKVPELRIDPSAINTPAAEMAAMEAAMERTRMLGQAETEAALELDTYGIEKKNTEFNREAYARWRRHSIGLIETALSDNTKAMLQFAVKNGEKVNFEYLVGKPENRALNDKDVSDLKLEIKFDKSGEAKFHWSKGEDEIVLKPTPGGMVESELEQLAFGPVKEAPKVPDEKRDSDWTSLRKVRALNSTLLAMRKAILQEGRPQNFKSLQHKLGAARLAERTLRQSKDELTPYQKFSSPIPYELIWWGYHRDPRFWEKRERLLGFNLPAKALLERNWSKWWGGKILRSVSLAAALLWPASELMLRENQLKLEQIANEKIVAPVADSWERFEWAVGQILPDRSGTSPFGGMNPQEYPEFAGVSDMLSRNTPPDRVKIFSLDSNWDWDGFPNALILTDENIGARKLAKYQPVEPEADKFSLITRSSFKVTDGKFLIPGVDGYLLADLEAYALFPKGDKRPPRHLTGIRLEREPNDNYYLGNLKDTALFRVNPGLKVIYRARYSPYKSLAPNQVYVPDQKKVKQEAHKLRAVGASEMADTLEMFDYPEGKLAIEHFLPALEMGARYSYVPPDLSRRAQQDNEYSFLAPFIHEGRACIHCDKAGAIAEEFIRKVAEPGMTRKRTIVVPEDQRPDDFSDLHAQVSWKPYDALPNQLPTVFDTTPTIEDPRNKARGVTIQDVYGKEAKEGLDFGALTGSSKRESSLDRSAVEPGEAEQPKAKPTSPQIAPEMANAKPSPAVSQPAAENPAQGEVHAPISTPSQPEVKALDALNFSNWKWPDLYHQFRSRGQEAEKPPESDEEGGNPPGEDSKSLPESSDDERQGLIKKLKTQLDKLTAHYHYPTTMKGLRVPSESPYAKVSQATRILLDLLENPTLEPSMVQKKLAELEQLGAPSLYLKPGETAPESLKEHVQLIRRAIGMQLHRARKYDRRHKVKKYEGLLSTSFNREAVRPLVQTWRRVDWNRFVPNCRELAASLKEAP